VDCLVENTKRDIGKVEQLKIEWKRLWTEHFNDKVRAEGIAIEDYPGLFVEKGTVVFATRDSKLLTFRGILEEHGIGDVHRFVSPAPEVGGWGKFIRASGVSIRPRNRSWRATGYVIQEEKKPQQLKKGGRGWLHH